MASGQLFKKGGLNIFFSCIKILKLVSNPSKMFKVCSILMGARQGVVGSHHYFKYILMIFMTYLDERNCNFPSMQMLIHSIIKRIKILLTSLTTPHFCACPKPWQGFPTSYLFRGLFCVYWVQLSWEVIVPFVDIGGIYNHLCLNFLFIINSHARVKGISCIYEWISIALTISHFRLSNRSSISYHSQDTRKSWQHYSIFVLVQTQNIPTCNTCNFANYIKYNNYSQMLILPLLGKYLIYNLIECHTCWHNKSLTSSFTTKTTIN